MSRVVRVALADDHAMVRDGLRRALEGDGEIAVVLEAASGEELLGALLGRAVDACVVDLSMPGMGGLQAIEQLRRMQPALGIIAISFHPPVQYAVRAVAAGAAAYLPKEAPTAELIRAVRTVADGGRYLTEEVQELLLGALRRGAGDGLSNRELSVLIGLARGRTLAQLGRELGVSAKTVSTYRSRLLAKLDLANNAELVQYAISREML